MTHRPVFLAKKAEDLVQIYGLLRRISLQKALKRDSMLKKTRGAATDVAAPRLPCCYKGYLITLVALVVPSL